ncbi:hypothetical protein PM082_006865 [Marasmius tenuissimus]|nr:hypothetical protein PM082_006865 [Marasmius tenuissimus]
MDLELELSCRSRSLPQHNPYLSVTSEGVPSQSRGLITLLVIQHIHSLLSARKSSNRFFGVSEASIGALKWK